MNWKPWFTGIGLSMLLATSGCGNANNTGNAANAVGNAVGNAAGFAARGVGNIARGVGNAVGGVGNAVGNAAGDVARRTGAAAAGAVNGVTWGGTQSVAVDAAAKTVHIRLNRVSNQVARRVPGAVGDGVRNEAMAITVPTGWTLTVAGGANVGAGVSFAHYRPAAPGRPGGTAAMATGTATGPNLGTTLKGAKAGQYAVVAHVNGRQVAVLDVITVSAGTRVPTVSSTAMW
ncbi:MAG: hypothetical protein K6T78_02080 [Alicyclobacillus sp.]|nr:hypothetical protein [Alicyclobacillus sp.]